MTSKPDVGEMRGRVRRLLERLSADGMRLREAGDVFTVLKARTELDHPEAKVSRDIVLLCLKRDLLACEDGHLVLSAPGRAWLLRSASAGDAFREQHQLRRRQFREIDGSLRPVIVNEGESPLGWLQSRKDRHGRPLLSEYQFAAGERLRADYWFAQLSPRVTSNWSSLASTDRSRRAAPAPTLREDVLAAKERVRRALADVGPELSGVLIDICCELKGLEEAEKAQGWPQRAGKVVLQIALSRLARH